MKATGVVRKIDELGRIVIPRELTRTFDFGDRQPMEFFVTDDAIVLKKYKPGCEFCSNIENLRDFKGHKICLPCLKEMATNSKEKAAR